MFISPRFGKSYKPHNSFRYQISQQQNVISTGPINVQQNVNSTGPINVQTCGKTVSGNQQPRPPVISNNNETQLDFNSPTGQVHSQLESQPDSPSLLPQAPQQVNSAKTSNKSKSQNNKNQSSRHNSITKSIDGTRDRSQSMNRQGSRGRPRSVSANPNRGRSRSTKPKPGNVNSGQTQVQECASSQNAATNKSSNAE